MRRLINDSLVLNVILTACRFLCMIHTAHADAHDMVIITLCGGLFNHRRISGKGDSPALPNSHKQHGSRSDSNALKIVVTSRQIA